MGTVFKDSRIGVRIFESLKTVPILLVVGCTAVGQRFERGVAVTVPEDLQYGGRAWIGMPKGNARVWVTELAVLGNIDGFFAACGGVGVRAQRGATPRAALALGVGGRSFSADMMGKNGLSGYGEALVGWDFDVTADLTIGLSAVGSLYLNGDTVEPHVLGAVGLIWK